MNQIDKILNNFTMYKVVLYGLLVLALSSFVLSIFNFLSYQPLELAMLLLVLFIACFVSNLLLSKIFQAVVNAESWIITALILFFLLWPSTDTFDLFVYFIAGAAAMTSKYLISYKKKHIFNPAAIAAVLLFVFNTGAIWWVATPSMLPLTLVIGLLVVRKIRRFTMFFTFIAVTVGSYIIQIQLKGLNVIVETLQFFTSFPTIFLGTIMLTEPATTPPTKRLQMVYASIVGFLFSWQGGSGLLILTTEFVLLFGNVFSFIVSPKYKLFLRLKRKQKIAANTLEFSFEKPPTFKFKPGQYLEWTLPILKNDIRGNRRYFTISSSPAENEIRLATKVSTNSSSFKKELQILENNDTVLASQLLGDFTLPEKIDKKLVFMAGGIGITPFISMIKYLLDKKGKRDIVLFYSNKTSSEIAYKSLLDEAKKSLAISVVYIISDPKSVPVNWRGEKGQIDERMIRKYVLDIADRTFYISGPNAMVESYKRLLKQLKVRPRSIVTDYFPGF